MEENTNQKSKYTPIVAGVLTLVVIVGAFWFLMQGAGVSKAPKDKPNIVGLLDIWEIEDAKVYVEVAPDGKKLEKYQFTVEPTTTYIHRKGRRSDEKRIEEKGALANISDGLYVGVYFKPGTQVADTIIYANWPL